MKVTVSQNKWAALAWAKEHCPSYISFTLNDYPMTIKKLPGGLVKQSDKNLILSFNDDCEATYFILR